MEVIRFRDETISGEQESSLKWSQLVDKDELMVEVFTSEELFEDLSIYWKDLEKRALSPVFVSYDWAYTWWKHFGRNKQRSLFIITVWDGTKLIGLAPFYKGYSTFASKVIEKRLQLIGSGGSQNEQYGHNSDLGIGNALDILVDHSYTDIVAAKLLDVFTPEFLEADVITLNKVHDDSFIKKNLFPLLEEEGLPVSLLQLESNPRVQLRNYPSLNGQLNQTAKNKVSSEVPETDYNIEELTSREEINIAADTILSHRAEHRSSRVEEKRFKNFFRDILSCAHQNGWLWFKQVKDSQGVCAARIALHYQGKYYDVIGGFTEFRSSPEYDSNIVLLLNLVEEAIANNVKVIELLDGSDVTETGKGIGEQSKSWKVQIKFSKRNGMGTVVNNFASFFYSLVSHKFRLRVAR